MARSKRIKLTPEEREIFEKDPKLAKLNENRKELEEQMANLLEQEKAIAEKARNEANKIRTNRQLAIGELVEKHLGPVEENSHLWDVLEAYLPNILENANDPKVLKKIAKNKGFPDPMLTPVPEDEDEEESL